MSQETIIDDTIETNIYKNNRKISHIETIVEDTIESNSKILDFLCKYSYSLFIINCQQ